MINNKTNSPLISETSRIFSLAEPRNIPKNIECKITDVNALRLLPQKLAHLYFAHHDEIIQFAKSCAEYCRVIVIDPKHEALLAFFESTTKNNSVTESSVNGNSTTVNPVNGNTVFHHSVNESTSTLKTVNRKSVKLPTDMKERKRVYDFLCRYVTTIGLTPPTPTNTIQMSGCLKRLVDNRWWQRRIRTLINQANESAAITANVVSRTKQIYASNITTKNYLQRVILNEALLSSHYIINDLGQRFSLKEISDLTISNPKNLMAELMCRSRGFEDLAKSLGHEALFITITCPSKYHRAYSKSGAENPKWGGYMPDDSQRYLNKLWQKTRAELQRKNIKPYGFRVVEPQHDGTPHWHCLFFVKPEHVKQLQSIIRFYALQEDGDEQGASENRCDVKLIDPNKGSATGYILKYIVKNINGEGLGEDKFGNDSISVAKRIKAWASCWNIRQFQQIGGASVSVWRELRRLKEKFCPESTIEKSRNAADTSDWQGYILSMGGIEAKPKSHPIKLYYDINVNIETGECSQSYYDGEIVTKIKGLVFEGKSFITRTLQWRIERLA